MRRIWKRMSAGTIVLAMVVSLVGSTASVGLAQEEEVLSGFDLVQNDPFFQSEVLNILRLAEQAKTDHVALEHLKLIQENNWELHPRAWLSNSAWAVDQLKGDKLENWVDMGDSAGRTQAAAATGLVPYRSPAPAFSRNIIITKDFGRPIQTEPHICSNPENRQQLIMAATEYGAPYDTIYVSSDAGETWQGPRRVPLTDRTRISGDPVLACGRDSTVHHVFMSIGTRDFLLGAFQTTMTRSDIAVSASHDDGWTWEQPATVATNRIEFENLEVTDPNTGEVFDIKVLAFSFLDKPWITVGPDPDDPDKDVLYVSYTEFTEYLHVFDVLGLLFAIPVQTTSEIIVWSSVDDGATWQSAGGTGPLIALTEEVDNLFDDKIRIREVTFRFVQGSQIGVADDGTLYIAWYDSLADGFERGWQTHFVVASHDRGVTWREPVTIGETLEIFRQPRSAFFRNSAAASTQMDVATVVEPSGETHNEIYLVFASRVEEKRSDDGDINFVRGIDTGETIEFTEPLRLNSDDTDRLQFFPAIAAGDKECLLHAMWGDMRDDPGGFKYHIYYTQSEDCGETWGFTINEVYEPDVRVTDFPSNPHKAFPGGRFIGDYFAITTCGTPEFENDACMVWADARLGEFGGINQKIAFSRRQAIRAPEIVMNPVRGPAGQKVDVQAFYFQPELSLFVDIGGTITFGCRTSTEGGCSFSILMPMTGGEGDVTVRAFDETANVAEASYFAEFGLDDLVSKQDLESLTGVPITGASPDGEASEADGGDSPVGLIVFLIAFVLSVGGVGGYFVRRRWILRETKDL